jgi:hypothetical protein
MSKRMEIHHVLSGRKPAARNVRRVPRPRVVAEGDRGGLPFLLANPTRHINDLGRTIFVYQDVPGFQANSGGGPVVDSASPGAHLLGRFLADRQQSLAWRYRRWYH